jgi:hypothetical protein
MFIFAMYWRCKNRAGNKLYFNSPDSMAYGLHNARIKKELFKSL